MGKKKKLQALIFDCKYFKTKRCVKDYVFRNDYKIDKRLKYPVMRFGNSFKVRQRNPDWFNKKTFIVENIGKGVKGVYGVMK